MRLPSEVFKQSEASRKAPGGLAAPVAEGEMSREDKKRRRAQKKRAGKAAKKAKGADEGGVSAQKAKDEALVLSKAGKRAKMAKGGEDKTYGKSAAVFARLQNEAGAKASGDGPKKVGRAAAGAGTAVVSSSALRL